uniref:Uncharacterized protein n=1 Tax=Paramormyrops kingsleyae TaxID=1676925 RepID=A0A3B3R2J5_9TELE
NTARHAEATPKYGQPSGEENVEETNQEVLSPEPYIKHPLQNRWSLWFFKNDKSKTWQANQQASFFIARILELVYFPVSTTLNARFASRCFYCILYPEYISRDILLITKCYHIHSKSHGLHHFPWLDPMIM